MVGERVNREITNFHLLRWCATKVVKVVVCARTRILLSLHTGRKGWLWSPKTHVMLLTFDQMKVQRDVNAYLVNQLRNLQLSPIYRDMAS